MRCSKYVVPVIAVFALVIAGGASAFVVSHASSKVVQSQPPPGSCHVRGQHPFGMPDLHCTPGALNPAVTQATIRATICRAGYTISLELGGAANDSRNLWPEPGASPNLKDKVENYLHARVCDGRMPLAHAQRIIALSWVSFYNENINSNPSPKPKPPMPPPPDVEIVHPGAFCSPEGATGHTSAGTHMICEPASDGRDRWQRA